MNTIARILLLAVLGLVMGCNPKVSEKDLSFLATQKKPLTDPLPDLTEIGMAAGDCLARAIARGVYEATALPFPGALPAWRDKFGKST